jgi:uncharacterized membrane protein YccC
MPRPKVLDRVVAWFRRSSTQTRLLLALKSAVAAGLAWAVANLVPGAAGEYPYYAPLGAIVAMNPTIAQSARQGAQTVLGLGLGAVIAVAFIALGRPTPLTVALTVGVAVLLSSARLFGAQRSWVATAALFVLLLGYSQADEYSFGYILQMLIGVAIGLSVNLLFPPLYYAEARRVLDDARAAVIHRLRSIAEQLDGDSEPAEDERLRAAMRDARAAVGQAGESKRGNPRARRHRGALEDERHQLQALEGVSRCVEEIGDIVDTLGGHELYADVRTPLTDAVRDAAEMIEAWNSERLTAEELDSVGRNLDALDAIIDAAEDRGVTVRMGLTASTMLRRIRWLLVDVSDQGASGGQASSQEP